MRKALLNYCREKGLKLSDLKDDLLDLVLELNLLDDIKPREHQGHKDLQEFHERIVQETINFINGHPDIKEMIRESREKISEKLDYTPDTRVYLWINGLEESLDSGEWVPGSDSSLGVYIGTTEVIISM